MSGCGRLVVWVVMMAAQSAHGVLRGPLLAPRVGEFRARQMSFVTGMLLLTVIVYAFIPWLNARTLRRLVTAGLRWVALALGFEVALGTIVPSFHGGTAPSRNTPWGGSPMGFRMLVLAALPRGSGQVSPREALRHPIIFIFPVACIEWRSAAVRCST